MEFATFLDELKAFLEEENVSLKSLADGACVPYSQVYGWVKGGKGVRVANSAKKVRKYIMDYRRSSGAKIPDVIQSAVIDVWDGCPTNAVRIANVVRSLKPLMTKS